MAKSSDGFLSLATTLVDSWKGDEGWAQRLAEGNQIGVQDLAKGLKTLTDADLLTVGKLFAGDDFKLSDSALSLAKDAIKTFQNNYVKGISDGIFGSVTFKAMKNLKECHKADDSRKKELAEDSLPFLKNARRNKNIIFYYVDNAKMEAEIQGVSTDDLITDAWNLWQKHADFKIVNVDDEDEANVVINMRSLGDGVGGMLGLAHVGGKGISQKLECSLDKDETWTAAKFRVATCHELGHILGLSHANGGGQLMSPFLSDITEPAAGDISRVQAEWGAPRAAPGPVIIEGARGTI